MTLSEPTQRRLPIGAEVTAAGVDFRVWAPQRKSVAVSICDSAQPPIPLLREPRGYFSGTAGGIPAGALYGFLLDDEPQSRPDPASRFQPRGPHGPSQVINPQQFQWSDAPWPGLRPSGQVVYELHVGTFTPEGNWAGAMERLDSLADLGITCIEAMPVGDFVGNFNWGYDGVNLFAPFHGYGSPDDFRAFIDRAHRLGIGVILDVVYNHFGADGNYLTLFSSHYLSDKVSNDWGVGINFDDANAAPVREYYLANVRYWISEFHLDGLRFDATQAICDQSPCNIMREMCDTARAAAGERRVLLIGENEPQDTRVNRPSSRGGYGMDALWNDDFHHSATVALTGHKEAYYTDYLGHAQEFVAAAKWGYLYQGQRYAWQGQRRGTPALDLPPTAFVNFLQNHDQIANSGRGWRIDRLTSLPELRAMTAVLLLSPQTPMLFMGQEFAAKEPFYYFADPKPEQQDAIRQGRAHELSQFPTLATPEMQRELVEPAKESTFRACKLDWSQLQQPSGAAMHALHKELLRIRRQDPVIRRAYHRGAFDGAVLGERAFLFRYFGPDNDDRLLLVNLDLDLDLSPAPEPLLAPPLGKRWDVMLSTEEVRFGGAGTPHPDTEREGWLLHGRCAILLRPVNASVGRVETRVKKFGLVNKDK